MQASNKVTLVATIRHCHYLTVAQNTANAFHGQVRYFAVMVPIIRTVVPNNTRCIMAPSLSGRCISSTYGG
jgi:hypothetical protein